VTKNIAKAFLCILIISAIFVAFSGCTTTNAPKAKIIGVQSGTTGEMTARDLVGAGNETHVKSFEHVTDVFPALQAGQVDAVINDYPVSAYYADSPQYKGQFKFVGKVFPTKEPYAIVLNKENTNLTKAMNVALAQIVADGTYAQLADKYSLPADGRITSVANVSTNDTYSFTTITPGKIKVATEAAWMPFEGINSSDADTQTRFIGFDMDLMREMAKRLNTTVEFTDQPFSGIITAVQAKQFDAGISSFSITADRQTQIDFSEPYFSIQQAILIRNNDTTITGAESLK
jgi:ABC-type amino acid transport substrate-binding protein